LDLGFELNLLLLSAREIKKKGCENSIEGYGFNDGR
jgi:hypothetical protein